MTNQITNEAIRGTHALSGTQQLILETCKHMPQGTCSMGKPLNGTPQAVFGRLFDCTMLNDQPSINKLRSLADDMVQTGDVNQNGKADAGMAFVGQFIDHDLTLDATTELGKAAGDVTNVRNFRTPRLDLDCIYGGGPEVSPHLFESNGYNVIFGRRKGEGNSKSNKLDLARNRNGTALIGDPRNDENLFVSQIHGQMFIQKHNEFADQMKDFEEAREHTIEWYHELIRTEFLPQVISPKVLGPLLQDYSRGYLSDSGEISWKNAPDMPVEFSAAAFRFGHSLVRQKYNLNDEYKDVSLFSGGDSDSVRLNGFAPVLEEHNLDLDKFFGTNAQKSRPIDTKLPEALFQLPKEVVGDGEANLAFRNMNRGQLVFDLPSGEQVASFMGFKPIATHELIKKNKLTGQTPLWFYILAEAEKNKGKLGPVGGTLVGGILLNLMLRQKEESIGHSSQQVFV